MRAATNGAGLPTEMIAYRQEEYPSSRILLGCAARFLSTKPIFHHGSSSFTRRNGTSNAHICDFVPVDRQCLKIRARSGRQARNQKYVNRHARMMTFQMLWKVCSRPCRSRIGVDARVSHLIHDRAGVLHVPYPELLERETLAPLDELTPPYLTT